MYLSSRPKVNIVLTFIALLSLIFSSLIVAKSAFPIAYASAQLNQTSSQSDWPMFGYDQQHSHFNSNETTINSSNVSNLVKDWETSFGVSVFESSPTVVNGVAYIGTTNNGNYQNGGLYAVNVSTGQILWSYINGDGFNSTPAVVNGVVYVGGAFNDYTFYALDATTGKVLWQSTPLSGPAYSSPVVVNGMVFFGGYGTNDNVYAFNANGCGQSTCSPVWKFAVNNFIYPSPAVDNGVVYIDVKQTVYALNATTGIQIWATTINTQGAYLNSSPGVSNGIVYVGSEDDNLYAFDETTGAILWIAATGSLITSSPAIANGVVYVGSLDNNLYAFNASTGAKLWTGSTGGRIDESSPAVANGVIYIGSQDGYLYAFNANGCGQSTCSSLWRFLITQYGGQNSMFTSPVISDGILYYGWGDLFAFNLPNITPSPSPTPVQSGSWQSPSSNGYVLDNDSVTLSAHAQSNLGVAYVQFDVQYPGIATQTPACTGYLVSGTSDLFSCTWTIGPVNGKILNPGPVTLYFTVWNNQGTSFEPAAPITGKLHTVTVRSGQGWAGYATVGNASKIESYFTVGPVTCHAGDEQVANWVGAGGFNTNLAQIGVVTKCISTTPLTYTYLHVGVWETVGSGGTNGPQYILNHLVLDGNKMYASIVYANGKYTLTLQNLSRNWKVTKTVTVGSTATGDCIQEAPQVGASNLDRAPMPDYGTFTMTCLVNGKAFTRAKGLYRFIYQNASNQTLSDTPLVTTGQTVAVVYKQSS